jgi:hypothetical protein
MRMSRCTTSNSDTGGKFSASVNYAGGKFATVSKKPAAKFATGTTGEVNLPTVSLTPLANNWNSIKLLTP